METIDLNSALKGLARTRPIFHSEADFQHALAWQLQTMFPNASIRLEVPFRRVGGSAEYVDLLVIHEGKRWAIELKYKTRSFKSQINGESFDLQSHSAHDLGRYDFLADVQRLERFVNDARADAGAAILLTNDSAYWLRPSRAGTIDEQLRLSEGRAVSGPMGWLAHASTGTTKGRTGLIDLRSRYQCKWMPYAPSQMSPGATFRYMLWTVDA